MNTKIFFTLLIVFSFSFANDLRRQDSLALIAIKEKNPEPLNGSWNISYPLHTWGGVRVNRDGRVDSVRLEFGNMKIIPSEIGQLTELVYLNMSDNKLDTISQEIEKCTKLQHLDLAYNSLATLPSALGTLEELDSLKIYENELTSLPSSLGNLTKLTFLRASHNKITEIPESFSGLINLDELNLTHNEISQIPAEVCELPNLKTLALPYNKLKELPAEIGNAPKLFNLYLNFNELRTLPANMVNLGPFGKLELVSNYLSRENVDEALIEWLDYESPDWDRMQKIDGVIQQKMSNSMHNNVLVSLKNGNLKITADGGSPIQSVKIFSLTGREVLSSEYEVKGIDVGMLGKGTYLLSVFTKDHSYSASFSVY